MCGLVAFCEVGVFGEEGEGGGEVGFEGGGGCWGWWGVDCEGLGVEVEVEIW